MVVHLFLGTAKQPAGLPAAVHKPAAAAVQHLLRCGRTTGQLSAQCTAPVNPLLGSLAQHPGLLTLLYHTDKAVPAAGVLQIEGTVLVALESTPSVHNIIVCTLCSVRLMHLHQSGAPDLRADRCLAVHGKQLGQESACRAPTRPACMQCYPTAVLGTAPSWYKSRAYRCCLPGLSLANEPVQLVALFVRFTASLPAAYLVSLMSDTDNSLTPERH